jgi:ABC-type nickel/cobalt efflux system permease component RcnA
MPEPVDGSHPLTTGGRAGNSQGNGPLSVRSLVALGITGGILPCPSALVVMLSAVALHRVAFGMILIVAFSVGLAVVLTSIGLCVVYMRAFMERIPSHGKLVQRLPVMSAAFVTLIGLVLVFKSLHGGGY